VTGARQLLPVLAAGAGLFLGGVARAAPAEAVAALYRPPGDRERVARLVWLTKTAPVHVNADGELFARVLARYPAPGWTLILQGRHMPRIVRDAFRYDLPLEARATRLSVLAVGPLGEVTREHVVVVVPEGQWKRLREKPGVGPRRFSASANAGFTYAAYREEPLGVDLKQVGLTVKVNAGYKLIPRLLDVAGNAFLTALPLTHSPSSITATRFYGINARLGYRVPFSGTVEWNVLLGWYFWGMVVPDRSYGISDLTGPQIFITVGFPSRGGTGSVVAYGKLAPLADRPRAISLAHRELAFGGSVQLTRAGAPRLWALTLDISQTSVGSAAQGNHLYLTTASLGLQTGL
jgi:hypothetical protein